jgi:hypothetical protein
VSPFPKVMNDNLLHRLQGMLLTMIWNHYDCNGSCMHIVEYIDVDEYDYNEYKYDD